MGRKFELIAPCHFGLEAVLKREIHDLGYEVTAVDDGRVSFAGDEDAVARANIFLRSAERILIKAGSFYADTYDRLFEETKALDWSRFLTKDCRFWVAKAASVKSRLFSPSDIQSIVKKAMVESMKKSHRMEWFPETGPDYPVRVFLKKDQVTIGLDTTGESLHKRGYRKLVAKAPLQENLAAALILLTPWKKNRILVDPFCGSGTFPIEAAMMAANMAPGMQRSFLAEDWTNLIEKKLWYDCIDEANDLIDTSEMPDIQGYDIDPAVIETARENASLAGVLPYIHFQRRPVSELSHPKKYGFLITNPPYGERLSDKEELREIYRTLGERFRMLDCWSMYLLTGYEDALRDLSLKPEKNRKLYNGMLKTYFYQFPGPKPPSSAERKQPL